MSHKYYLFRGIELIGSAEDAGYLHDIGESKDLLVCWHNGKLRAFRWSLPEGIKGHWIYVPEEVIPPEVRLTLTIYS